ncbi:uncharacterized protein LOC121517082 [Cheilinus undulatus]|uniref:uncharacterized protein LOC121517082 n=1 Tax=Cheilinus undulatus TaxID=241271 RepID=UPI001BD638D5|nr:uncharacterized protein LOC121517082 [Cheilinus undulatus]
MKLHNTLLLFLLILILIHEGEACLGESGVITRTVPEGEDVTFRCFFDDPDERKVFCRGLCREEDILVETTGFKAQRGRYRMDYNDHGPGRPSVLTLLVSIHKLTKDDSGTYKCVFRDGRMEHQVQVFELTVKDAPDPEKSQTFSSAPSASAPETSTIKALTGPGPNQTLHPTSPPPASTPTALEEPEDLAKAAAAKGLPPEPHTTGPLNVQLFLVLVIIVSSAALLVVCRTKTRRPEEPVGLDYVTIASADRVPEEVGEKTLEI